METKYGYITIAPVELEEGEERTLIFVPDTPLANLCAFGVDHGFSHLWISPHFWQWNMPDVDYFKAAQEEWDLFPIWRLKNAPAGVPNHLRSVTGFRQKHLKAVGQARNQINIIFCAPWAGWEWARRPDLTARECLEMIATLEKLLGTPVSGSPGNTGYTYLTHVNWNRKNYFGKVEGLADAPFDRAVQNILWTREPTPQELSRKYLLKIDKNAAFPRAASEYKFGVDKLVHVTGAPGMQYWSSEDSKKAPVGIWKIHVISRLANLDFPDPIKCDGWYTTPVVQAALALGHKLECPEEAWVFPESHYVLRETMLNLWDMRVKFPSGDPHREAFKQIMNDLVGLFHMPELVSAKYRPDWYAQVTGGCVAILLQNMQSFAQKFDLYPVLSHIDCIVYCSPKLLDEVFPDNRTSMGGYKHEWQLEMTDEIRAILTSGKGSAWQLQQLNAIAAAQAEAAEAQRLAVVDDYPFAYTGYDDEDEWDDDY